MGIEMYEDRVLADWYIGRRPPEPISYTRKIPVFAVEDRYLDDHVLGWTDISKVVTRMNERLPYNFMPFLLAHELKHIEFDRRSKNQDEKEVDSEAADMLRTGYRVM